MRDVTLKELVDWILANRSKAAFRDYSPNKIANLLIHSMQQGVFCFSFDKEEKINGVVCGERTPYNVMIHDILTTSPGVIKKFMKHYMTLYPYHTILAERKGKLVTYTNPSKLERRLQ